MPKTIALVIAGFLFLAVLAIFPGLSFQKWLEEKFKEADGEPTTWK